ncbi:hypothetical protein [Nonomuraea terrae]|uniref:hypothetical protein n=1 Tax=Nonomuraea terrae TaxID=2530383 RepID=UPI001404313B|nr:hypothetical protein [Nonomuraea terrae]
MKPPAGKRGLGRHALLIAAAATAFLAGLGVTAFVLLDEEPGGRTSTAAPDLAGVKPVFPAVADPHPKPVQLTEPPEACGVKPGTLEDLVPRAGQSEPSGTLPGCRWRSDIPMSEWGRRKLLLGGLYVTFQSVEDLRGDATPSAAEAISLMSLAREDTNASWEEVTGLGEEALVDFEDEGIGAVVLARVGAVLITVGYSGDLKPKGPGAIYSTDKLDEQPAVEGALRAARDVVAAVGGAVGEVGIGAPAGTPVTPAGPRDPCTFAAPATLERLAVRSKPLPIGVSDVADGAAGSICLRDGMPRLQIRTGVMNAEVGSDAATLAHRAYLERYHHAREGMDVDTLDRPSLRFRTLSGLGDEAFVSTYTAYSQMDAGGSAQCAVIYFRLRHSLTEITYCADVPEEAAWAAATLVASDAAAALAK